MKWVTNNINTNCKCCVIKLDPHKRAYYHLLGKKIIINYNTLSNRFQFISDSLDFVVVNNQISPISICLRVFSLYTNDIPIVSLCIQNMIPPIHMLGSSKLVGWWMCTEIQNDTNSSKYDNFFLLHGKFITSKKPIHDECVYVVMSPQQIKDWVSAYLRNFFFWNYIYQRG